MLKSFLNLLPAVFFFLSLNVAWAQPVITTATFDTERVITAVLYLPDSSNNLSFKTLSDTQYLHNFKTTSPENQNIAADINSYWVTFILKNNSSEPGEWLLDFEKWTYVNCYVLDTAGIAAEKITGALVPFLKRDFPAWNKNFICIQLKANQSFKCFVKLQKTEDYVTRPGNLNFKIQTKASFTGFKAKQDSVLCFFTGVFLVLFIYNLFIFISTRDNNYPLYLIFVFFTFAFSYQNLGYNFEFFKNFESYPHWYAYTEIIFSSVYGFIVLSFTNKFLRVYERFPFWIKVFRTIKVLLVIIIVPGVTGYSFIATTISSFLEVATLLAVFIVSVLAYVKRYPSSGYFLLAQSAFITGLMIYLLNEMFFFHRNTFFNYVMFTGSFLETLLLSFALANRINNLKKDNDEKQGFLIEQLKEDKLLQTRENRELEIKVAERTSELQVVQEQLIQQDKLAALGLLTAGIAHEIKNPLNFVNNFSELSVGLIKEFEETTDETERAEILDLIKKNLSKINSHGKRVDSIVHSMLQHSRTGSNAKELVDINLLAEEYLTLSYQGMRSTTGNMYCTIEKNLEENLPLINCVPQDLSRVILNLLNNAFYAVNEKAIAKKQMNQNFDPIVKLTTSLSDNRLLICISDNGNGLSQKAKDSLFQPFFTTKPTGVGTGLGLSKSYDIVKAHGGEIKAQSIENIGTTFIIILPLEAKT